jgi:glycosyltransferase involved in cell wall biosynthesis
MLLIPSARAAHVPVVIGSHRSSGNVFTAIRRVAQSVVFRLADRIVCNCKAAADHLLSYGVPARKLVIIPNFIPDEVFAPCLPALPRSQSVVRLGMVARMNHPVKNYPLLLRGVARLVAKFPNLEVLLVGDGPLRNGLEQLAQELRIASHVRFTGDRRDVPAIMRSLDIAVLTSDSEGLSNAILEAMAVGLPVVASRVGGNPELVEEGQTGLLFRAGSDIEFASAVETLLLNPELRRRMGEEARRRALEKYQVDSVLEQFKTLYLSLLQEKRIV